MKKILFFLGVIIMSVSCSLGFNRPVNGIILHPGHALENSAADMKDYIGKDLYYQPDAGCIMIHPDLELKSCGGSSPNFTDGDGEAVVTDGTWQLITLPGLPDLKLLHQTDTTKENWILQSASTFGKNQGFMVYWRKYATANTLTDGNLFFSLTDPLAPSVYGTLEIKCYANKYIEIYRIKNNETYWKKEIPINFSLTDSPIMSLTCFFADKYIIIGINGVEKTIALDVNDATLEADSSGTEYPILSSGTGQFEITGSGSGVFGFKRLKYPLTLNATPEDTSVISPYFDLGADNTPSSSTVFKITKQIVPTNCSITGYFANNKPVEIEGTPGSGTPTGRVRYGFTLRSSDGVSTPYIYSVRMKDAQTRSSVTPSSNTLNSDIVSYQEDITGNKDGSFGDWTSRTIVTMYETYRDTIFTGRNAKMTLNLNPGDGSVQRAVHYADTLEISRSEPGDLTLDISAQSIVKRLKLTPILRPESFDDRGWRHGDLMSYLATLGGVTLNADTYTSDPLLPASGLADRPNWQFNPGVSIWDAMNTVREYSGWLLYPDNNNELTYKPFPTSASTPDWTIDCQTCLDLKYTIGDLARTRFMVLGQAGADDSAGRFKAGDGIMVYKTNSTLETALGESRPLWIFDPALSNLTMVNNTVNKLHDWYSALHKIVSFTIPDFNGVDSAAKKYSSMTLNQVVTISDADIADIDGVYMLVGLHLSGNLAMVSANVELISL